MNRELLRQQIINEMMTPKDRAHVILNLEHANKIWLISIEERIKQLEIEIIELKKDQQLLDRLRLGQEKRC